MQALSCVFCRLLAPTLPEFSLLPNLVTDSFAVAIVGFSMCISLSKIFALKHGYSVDGNQVSLKQQTKSSIQKNSNMFPWKTKNKKNIYSNLLLVCMDPDHARSCLNLSQNKRLWLVLVFGEDTGSVIRLERLESHVSLSP